MLSMLVLMPQFKSAWAHQTSDWIRGVKDVY